MEESMWKSILKIQKVRRVASYFGFYCFFTGLVYAYTNNSTRAGISRADQFYSYFPAGTELLFDATKLYKTALGNAFEVEEWGPIEFSIMVKHFQRQGKAPYAYHARRNFRQTNKRQTSLKVESIHDASSLTWTTGWYRVGIEGRPKDNVH